MYEPPRNLVMQRLDCLEQENRWWKLLGIATVTMLGLAILWEAFGREAAGREEELRAQRLPGFAKNGHTHVR